MSTARSNITLTDEMRSNLEAIVAKTGLTPEQAMAEALQWTREAVEEPTAYEVAQKAGWFDPPTGASLPTDLSTNPSHMDGFGRD